MVSEVNVALLVGCIYSNMNKFNFIPSSNRHMCSEINFCLFDVLGVEQLKGLRRLKVKVRRMKVDEMNIYRNNSKNGKVLRLVEVEKSGAGKFYSF